MTVKKLAGMKIKGLLENKETYTTGQVARICQVAPRTVSKWIDTGKMKGAFRIPGSNDRRVPRMVLLRFIHDNKMSFLLGQAGDVWQYKVMFLGMEARECNALSAAVAEQGQAKAFGYLDCSDSVAAAGFQFTEFNPHLVIVDSSIGRTVCEQVATSIRAWPSPVENKLLLVIGEDGSGEDLKGRQDLFNFFLRRPFPMMDLAALVRAEAKEFIALQSAF